MKVGMTVFSADYAMPPAALARACEERGFDSLWLPGHSHIPTSRRTPWPGARPGDEALPRLYKHLLDPLISLAAAASVTERLRLGTAVCLPAQHDPLWLAKQVATLDAISGGRVDFGIGFGWNREQYQNHGVDFARRRAHTREVILALKALWTQEEAAFDGEFVRFEPSWAWPKPVQRPHPPIWIGGGWGPVLFEAIAEYADGWLPISARASLADRLAGLQRAAEAAGRDPASLRVTVLGARPEVAALRQLEAEGVERVAFTLPDAPADVLLPQLDAWTPLIDKVR